MKKARSAAIFFGTMAAVHVVISLAISILAGRDIPDQMAVVTLFNAGASLFFSGVAIIAGAIEKK